MQSHFPPPPGPHPHGWWPPSEWHWLSDRLSWLEHADRAKTVAITRLKERDRAQGEEIKALRSEVRRQRHREAIKAERKAARKDVVKLAYVVASIAAPVLYVVGLIPADFYSRLMSVLQAAK